MWQDQLKHMVDEQGLTAILKQLMLLCSNEHVAHAATLLADDTTNQED